MKNVVGIAGIVIAVIGLAIAVFQDELRPAPPPASEQLKERVAEVISGLAGVETVESKPRDWVRLTYIALGLAALVAGVASYVRDESHKISGMSGALGVVVMAWEYVLIGVIVAVVIYLLANFSLSDWSP